VNADMSTPSKAPSTGTINVALLGYGYAGKTFHAPLVASVPGLRLHTIVSSKGAQVQHDWPDARVVTDDLTAFTDPDVDLIVIATPNDLHAPQAHAALTHGKHVVVDKPFMLDTTEAREVIAHAEKAGRLLSVFHSRRWDSEFLTLRRLMSQGTLGDIAEMHSHYDRFRPVVRDRWRERPGPGAGLWFDLGPHQIDQALVLFGMPASIYADIAATRAGATVDDYFHVLLRYRASTRRVILHASSMTANTGPRFAVHGTRGSFIKYGMDAQENALKSGAKPGEADDWGTDPKPGVLTPVADDGVTAGACATVPSEPGDYRRFYVEMRDAIRDGAPVPVTPRQALDVMLLLELGVESARTHREISVTP
jgi:predicted dehydrogenase